MRLRTGRSDERAALVELMLAASLVWPSQRDEVRAHAEEIADEFPTDALEAGRVRVAVDDDDRVVGFSLVLPATGGVLELDGLFVQPECQHAGIGRALVTDVVRVAREAGATAIEVTAGPASSFYEKLGFVRLGEVGTRFGRAVRLRVELGAHEAFARDPSD